MEAAGSVRVRKLFTFFLEIFILYDTVHLICFLTTSEQVFPLKKTLIVYSFLSITKLCT